MSNQKTVFDLYKKKISLKEIHENLISLRENVYDLDKKILLSGAPFKNQKIEYNFFNFQKQIIQLEFSLDIYEEENNTDLKKEKIELKKIKENIKLITKYNDIIVQNNQKKTMDYLALLSFIFLPLSLITGYFGMNFQAMGTNPNSKIGIFSIKNPFLLVMTLFVISIILSIIVFILSNKDEK